MNKRTLIRTLFLCLFWALSASQLPSASAQVDVEQGRTRPPRPPRPPKSSQPPAAPDREGDQEGETVQGSMKLDRGGRVTISNRFGVITVKGYDGDTVEAKALHTDGRNPDSRLTLIKGDSARMRIALDALPGRRHGRGVDFQIQVPRYASVDIVDSQETEVEVGDVDGTVALTGGSGDVKVHQIGPLSIDWQKGDIEARDIKGRCSIKVFTGDVTVDNATGLVDVSSVSGEVRVTDAGENVKANAVSGDIILHCVKGRVDASAVSGSIELVGVKGDVVSDSVSSDISFKGSIREGGTYRLKSMSGDVAMAIQSDAPGFTVTMTTFSGEIETAFPIKVESAVQQNQTNRRIVGRFGNGQAKLSLDSFSSGVRITKAQAVDLKACK